jgi:hypothetical protein
MHVEGVERGFAWELRLDCRLDKPLLYLFAIGNKEQCTIAARVAEISFTRLADRLGLTTLQLLLSRSSRFIWGELVKSGYNRYCCGLFTCPQLEGVFQTELRLLTPETCVIGGALNVFSGPASENDAVALQLGGNLALSIDTFFAGVQISLPALLAVAPTSFFDPEAIERENKPSGNDDEDADFVERLKAGHDQSLRSDQLWDTLRRVTKAQAAFKRGGMEKGVSLIQRVFRRREETKRRHATRLQGIWKGIYARKYEMPLTVLAQVSAEREIMAEVRLDQWIAHIMSKPYLTRWVKAMKQKRMDSIDLQSQHWADPERSTQSMYSKMAEGRRRYSVQRTQVHERVVRVILRQHSTRLVREAGSGSSSVGRTKELLMLMGPPGCGKNTTISMHFPSTRATHVTVNCDDCLGLLPEYWGLAMESFKMRQELQAQGAVNEWSKACAHWADPCREEAKYIRDKLFRACIGLGVSMVYHGTGKNEKGRAQYQQVIQTAVGAGYSVRLICIHAKRATLVERVRKRAHDSVRCVPVCAIEAAITTVLPNFQHLCRVVYDGGEYQLGSFEAQLYDNDNDNDSGSHAMCVWNWVYDRDRAHEIDLMEKVLLKWGALAHT